MDTSIQNIESKAGLKTGQKAGQSTNYKLIMEKTNIGCIRAKYIINNKTMYISIDYNNISNIYSEKGEILYIFEQYGELPIIINEYEYGGNFLDDS